MLLYNFSTTRNFALRLLALTLISSSEAPIGFRLIILTIFAGGEDDDTFNDEASSNSSGGRNIIALLPTVGSRDSGTPANFRNCFFTMASSNE